jgi:hypothetical protein
VTDRRTPTTHPIDASTELGYCNVVADPHLYLRQGTRPDWPSGLTGIDSLAPIFAAEVYGAR